jgi:hypothetical protein
MDLTSSIRTDTLPAVASLLVPGAVASAPYVALLWGPPHELNVFVETKETLATAAGLLVVVGIGFLIESVGSYVEYYMIDRRHADRDAMLERWRQYLQIAWQTEPIGQHYLRRVLTIFKFELNMFVAAMAALPGVVALGLYGVVEPARFVLVLGLNVGVIAYLRLATHATSVLLDELRLELVSQARAAGALLTGDS